MHSRVIGCTWMKFYLDRLTHSTLGAHCIPGRAINGQVAAGSDFVIDCKIITFHNTKVRVILDDSSTQSHPFLLIVEMLSDMVVRTEHEDEPQFRFHHDRWTLFTVFVRSIKWNKTYTMTSEISFFIRWRQKIIKNPDYTIVHFTSSLTLLLSIYLINNKLIITSWFGFDYANQRNIRNTVTFCNFNSIY